MPHNISDRDNAKIARLMSDYFYAVDRIHDLQREAAHLKQAVLEIANPGRYAKGTITKVKATKVLVREHWRKAFVVLRRVREGGTSR